MIDRTRGHAGTAEGGVAETTPRAPRQVAETRRPGQYRPGESGPEPRPERGADGAHRRAAGRRARADCAGRFPPRLRHGPPARSLGEGLAAQVPTPRRPKPEPHRLDDSHRFPANVARPSWGAPKRCAPRLERGAAHLLLNACAPWWGTRPRWRSARSATVTRRGCGAVRSRPHDCARPDRRGDTRAKGGGCRKVRRRGITGHRGPARPPPSSLHSEQEAQE